MRKSYEPSFLVFYTIVLMRNQSMRTVKLLVGLLFLSVTCNMSQLYCDFRVRFVKEGTLERKRLRVFD